MRRGPQPPLTGDRAHLAVAILIRAAEARALLLQEIGEVEELVEGEGVLVALVRDANHALEYVLREDEAALLEGRRQFIRLKAATMHEEYASELEGSEPLSNALVIRIDLIEVLFKFLLDLRVDCRGRLWWRGSAGS